MSKAKQRTNLTCYDCGVKLSINEAICHNRTWGNEYPLFSCKGSNRCRSNEADESFVNQHLEEEYQRIVQKHKECEEFTREKLAYQAKHGPNAMFIIQGGSDPCA